MGIFITTGMRLNQYQYLEEESFTLQYGVKGVVERRKQQDEAGYRASVVAGVILCILGVIPLLLAAGLDAGDFVCVLCVDVLLILVALAAFLFVRFGAIWSSYQKLLQEEDYTPGGSRPIGSCPGSRGVLAAGHGHLLRDQLLHERLEDHLGGVAGGRGALRGGVRRSDSGGKNKNNG